MNKKKSVIYRSRSQYNDIVVTKEESLLTLYSPSNIRQSVMDMSNPIVPCLEYTQNILMGLLFCPDPDGILILGLGGATLPGIFSRILKNSKIDIVEIDLEIAQVAQKFFNFRETSSIRLFIEDASAYVNKKIVKYDIIVMDAYLGNKQPPSLSRADFFSSAGNLLTSKGVFIVNLMTSDKTHYNRMMTMLHKTFPCLSVLPCKNSGNAVIFATNFRQTDFLIELNSKLIGDKLSLIINFNALLNRLKKEKNLCCNYETV